MDRIASDLVKGDLPRKTLKGVHEERGISEEWHLLRQIKQFLLNLRAAILLLTAGIGFFLSYMTFFMVLQPALSTLLAQFSPATCQVLHAAQRQGRSNCSWSSCRRGCTTEVIFRCWQVIVYAEETQGNTSRENTNNSYPLSLKETETLNESVHDDRFVSSRNSIARLQLNAEGCGYESCSGWYSEFDSLGYVFPCYLNREGTVAVKETDTRQAWFLVAMGSLPLLLELLSLVIIYGLYCRKGAKDTTLTLSSSTEQLKERKKEKKVKLLLKITEELKESKLDLKLLMSVSELQEKEGKSAAAPVCKPRVNSWTDRLKPVKRLDRWTRLMRNVKERKLLNNSPSSSTTEIHIINITPVNLVNDYAS